MEELSSTAGECLEISFFLPLAFYLYLLWNALLSNKVEISSLKIRSLRPIVVCTLSPCLRNDFSFLSFPFPCSSLPWSDFDVKIFVFISTSLFFLPSFVVLSFVTNKGFFLLILDAMWTTTALQHSLMWFAFYCSCILCFMLHSMSSRNWCFYSLNGGFDFLLPQVVDLRKFSTIKF